MSLLHLVPRSVLQSVVASIGAITLLSGYAPLASAALALPPPAALLAQAQQSRSGLRDALLDLQQNVQEFRDPTTFDSYFKLLPEFEVLAQRFQLDAVYPKGVEMTGLRLVAHGIRWMDLSQRTQADVELYFRYADADVWTRALNEMTLLARDSRTAATRLERLAQNLEVVLLPTEVRFPNRPDVAQNSRELISGIALRFFKAAPTDAEARSWTARLNTPSTYLDAIEFLQEQLITEHLPLASIADRLMSIADKMARETLALPSYVPAAWGQTAMELILRSIEVERVWPMPQFTAMLDRLRPTHLQGLATNFVNVDKTPSQSYAPHYLDLGRALIQKLESSGLTREATELTRQLGRAAAPIQGRNLGLEGYYRLEAGDGTKFEMSIVYARNNMLYAALGFDGGHATKGFFNVTFDMDRQKFFASQREPDLDASPNPMISFTVNAQGEIEVDDPLSQPAWSKLRGRRVGAFTSFFPEETPQAFPTDGEYQGEMRFATGQVWQVELSITRFGSYSLGRLRGPAGVWIDFQTGTNGKNAVIYLTTGRLPQTSWIQLRGVRRGDYLEGQLISGARGLTVPSFKLKKVK